MTRPALALALAALLASTSLAQQPVLQGPVVGSSPGGFGPPPSVPHQVILPGPTPTPGPPINTTGSEGFYKSGGILVGRNGYFPYDTGAYLLGGTDGLARSLGFYRMEVPVNNVNPDAFPPLYLGGHHHVGRCRGCK
jgi:hypothetical protein